MRVVRRDTGEKEDVLFDEVSNFVVAKLDAIHNAMLEKAIAERDSRIRPAKNLDEFFAAVMQKDACLSLTPSCGDDVCEKEVLIEPMSRLIFEFVCSILHRCL